MIFLTAEGLFPRQSQTFCDALYPFLSNMIVSQVHRLQRRVPSQQWHRRVASSGKWLGLNSHVRWMCIHRVSTQLEDILYLLLPSILTGLQLDHGDEQLTSWGSHPNLSIVHCAESNDAYNTRYLHENDRTTFAEINDT